MSNPFVTTFDAYAPILAADFVAYHTRVITRLIEKYEGNMRGLANAYGTDGDAYRNSGYYISYTGGYPASPRTAIGVDVEALQKDGDKYAEVTIQSFVAKLTRKLAPLTDVEVLWAKGSGQFTITGKLGNRQVTVHQDRVFKISSKGTPFHQWPARIYVEGKFTTEAAFKKIA